jgi:hypothetical protein
MNPDMIQDDPGQWFLGEVDFDATKEHFTRLQPIAIVAEDGSKWEKLASNLQSRFPKRGLVCWFEAPSGTRKHMLVEFQATPNPSFDDVKRPDRQDKLQIRTAKAAVEVIEVGCSESRLREELTGEGIALDAPPVCRGIFKISAERWIGPFELVQRKGGYWGLQAGADLEAIPVYTRPPAAASSLSVDGKQRMLLVASAWTLTSPRLANWLPDVDVLRGVLKRLHKLDVDRFKELHLTYAAFEAYINAVAEAKLLPDQQLSREQAKAERVKELRAQLPLASEVVEEIVAALGKFDAVRKRFDERLGALALERKEDLDTRIAAERIELEKLQAAVAAAGVERVKLEKQIAASRKALSAELLEAEEVMRERLNKIREAPIRAVTEMLATSALLPSLIESNRRPRRAASALTASSFSEPAPVEEPTKVVTNISQALLDAGVALDSMFPLLGAFVGGLLPVCAGDAAATALRRIGRSLCGGEVWCLPVSPIATSLQDILAGTGLAGQRQVVGSLFDVIEAARQKPDALSLCVLEGIDLAPTDGYLIPLVGLVSDGSDGRSKSHCIPLLAADGSGSLEWPRNLLLAVTVARGRTSLPLPRTTWDVAPLFEFCWSETSTGTPSLAAGEITRVSTGRWLELRGSAERDCTSEIVVAASAKPPARVLALRLYRAAIALGAKPSDACQMIETHVLTPALASAAGSPPTGGANSLRRHFELATALISDSPTYT